jgi:hypothetical protein
MRTATLTLVLLLISSYCFATIIIVDKNGGGNFISIQSAINAAVSNDTVKVWPGTYFEQVTLNKNVVLMGSVYENTVITGSFNPTITMSSGNLQWFMISSLAGNGITLSGGTVKNCVISSCSTGGIYCGSGGPNVINCISKDNGGYGMWVGGSGVLNIINCISMPNSSTGFYRGYWGSGTLNLSYSNGSRDYTSGNQGCIDSDPYFTSDKDYHISEGSPCWNSGNPSLQDPDGSYSDMGYFGGPDCPIYPVVFEVLIEPSGSTINLKAKGRANY